MAQNLPSEFGRVLKTNTESYLKGAADATIKSSILLSKLQKAGRVKYRTDDAGTNLNWKVRKSKRAITPVVDGAGINVGRTNLYDEAKLGWFGYQVNDAMTEKERLINGSSTTRIINVVSGMIDELKGDMQEGVNAELYKNGETTTNVDRIHGLETMFQISTATIPTGGAGGAVLAVGAHGTLTYGGLAFSSVSNSNYYWRPTIVIDANSGQFGAGGWATGNALKIFDFAVVQASEKNNAKFPDLGITTFTWYNLLRLNILSKETIFIDRPGTMSEHSDDVGFHYARVNGVPVYPESDWPTMKQGGAHGMYLLYTSKLEYNVLGSNFYNVHMDEDIEKGLIKEFAISHYGQLKTATPRSQCKVVDK